MTELSPREIELRLKLRDDFEYYAPRCLTLITKEGQPERMALNQAQHYIHEKLQNQLATLGRVRAIILKGRQMGCSTYIQARYLWKTSQNKGKKAFILTHNSQATSNLYGMTKRFYSNLPDAVKPVIDKNNAAELDFKLLDSGYRVSTAGSQGVGRGSTIHLLHASEVAYWRDGEDHVPGLLQAVSDSDGTEIILESTANGPNGVFYSMTQAALEGRSEYEVIFVPWFWQAEYRRKVEPGFKLTPDERSYADTHSLDTEQMCWRRNKINTFIRGEAEFRREYPATVEEAFLAETEGSLWTRADFQYVSRARYEQLAEDLGITATTIGFDPAGSANAHSDLSGVVAASLLGDGNVYVLADRSGKYLPEQVVPEIAGLFHKLDADRLTIEVNYGGAWVPSMFNISHPEIPIYPVHARKGKRLRAEPVAHAYRQRKIIHVGPLGPLEDELCTWNPYGNDPSPNRMDALVYAVTDLMDLGAKAATPIISSFG